MSKLSLQQIADHYQISAKTFSKLVKSKRIPHERLKRQYRFNLAVVEAHLTAQDECPAKPGSLIHIARKPKCKGGNKYAEALGV